MCAQPEKELVCVLRATDVLYGTVRTEGTGIHECSTAEYVM